MANEQIEKLCKEKEQELLDKYYGNLVKEAAHGRSADGDARGLSGGDYGSSYQEQSF